MARPALTEEQRRETRRNIRRAAARLYAENGLAEISARAIAEQAGVSVGTLYSYFDNLTELMQSLWKEPVSRLITELEVALDGTENPLRKLQLLLDAYGRFAIEHHNVYRGAFLYVRPEAHQKPTQVSLEDDRFFNLFQKAVIEGQEQGLVRAGEPAVLAQTLWGGMHGAIALPLNLDRVALAPPQEAVQQMSEALIEWISAQS